MQVITDSEASIVLLLFWKENNSLVLMKSVLKKKKKRKKVSQSIMFRKVASQRTCQTTLHVNRQTERGKLKNKQANREESYLKKKKKKTKKETIESVSYHNQRET